MHRQDGLLNDLASKCLSSQPPDLSDAVLYLPQRRVSTLAGEGCRYVSGEMIGVERDEDGIRRKIMQRRMRLRQLLQGTARTRSRTYRSKYPGADRRHGSRG